MTVASPSPTAGGALHTLDLGVIGFTEALELQRRAARLRISGELPEDLLLLCEHPPVVSLGRAASSAAHVNLTPEALRARGAELHEAERGGDVTFHGPGQLVGYTIIDLKQHRQDLHWFLRQVEEALINAVKPFGISAGRVGGYTGVWVEDRKLASIGVHARDWVTWHGFALNVHTDLSWFDTIVPCGISDVQMTSLAYELGDRLPRREPMAAEGVTATAPTMDAVRQQVAHAFANTFTRIAEPLPERLGDLLRN